MASDYLNPAKYGDFPQVADVLRSIQPRLAGDDRNHVEEVIAVHELGRVPDRYAECLRRLTRTHRLGLVANLWSKKARWLRELRRAGVLDHFESLVFSSDHKCIKPSPVIFDLALKAFGVGKEQVVFVGDSLIYDIAGAKNSGLSAVWIDPGGSVSSAADYTVSDLTVLSRGAL